MSDLGTNLAGGGSLWRAQRKAKKRSRELRMHVTAKGKVWCALVWVLMQRIVGDKVELFSRVGGSDVGQVGAVWIKHHKVAPCVGV